MSNPMYTPAERQTQATPEQVSHAMVKAEKLPSWLVLQAHHSRGHAVGDEEKKEAVIKVRSRLEGIMVGA